METWLRKGHSHAVYLLYDRYGHNIGAASFKAHIEELTLVISFRLSPVDRNQRTDEYHLHTETLKEIRIIDDFIDRKLTNYLHVNLGKINTCRAEITSRHRTFQFDVHLGKGERVGFLPMVIERR